MNLKNPFVLLVSVSLSCGSALANEVDDACSAYNQHDYSLALKKLDALPAAARNAKSAYYKGLTLQALHRYKEADQEYRQVATQKKDLQLAGLARQGLIGLSRMPKQSSFHENLSFSTPMASTASSKPLQNKNVEGGNWKVAEPGFGAQGVNKEGMPDGWTFRKTSNGCGRH